MKIFRVDRVGSVVFAQRAVRGFTLLELMVVLAILALLGGLVGPKVLDYLGKAKSRTAIVQIAELEKTLDNFKLDVGRYPSTEEGLESLVKRPASANLWAGPYIKEVPKDPWNNPYKYANPGAGGGGGEWRRVEDAATPGRACRSRSLVCRPRAPQPA